MININKIKSIEYEKYRFLELSKKRKVLKLIEKEYGCLFNFLEAINITFELKKRKSYKKEMTSLRMVKKPNKFEKFLGHLVALCLAPFVIQQIEVDEKKKDAKFLRKLRLQQQK